MDALSTFIWVAFSSIAMFFFSNPLSGLIMFATLLLLLIVSRCVSLRKIIKSLPFILLVATCLLLFHAFSNPGHIILNLGLVSITSEGLREGSILFFRVAFVVLASFTFLWITDIRELMVGLVRIGIPYRYAFSIYLSLRYIPIMKAERDIIKGAIAVRCQSYKIGIKWRLRLWMRYIFLLVVNGLRKADQTAIAMQVRGFGIKSSRTFITPFHFNLQGLILISSFMALFVSLFWLFG